MASSISAVMVMWVVAMAAAAAASSQTWIEGEALRRSTWWRSYNTTTGHCNWASISCNAGGSVTEIWAVPTQENGLLLNLGIKEIVLLSFISVGMRINFKFDEVIYAKFPIGMT
ncbi:hypothetical protein CK203_085591 [Vitis vinifera]|uniref:Leucine-rich repeat-containing N-terminal plant-type domain-containing protein n=2 Tax=Vitis vinifera TaxID=29760 RepID=A0A438BWF7_VITVI|nr:hypothetical protein CK203_085591 [Vitis vinifera]